MGPQIFSTIVWAQIQAGIALLRQGGVIALPTDTLYGLGADFSIAAAVQRVLDIKGRPEAMGLPLLLSSANDLTLVATDVREYVWPLIDRFWPGALTLVVPRSHTVSDRVTGGRDTVAVRVPDHPVPRALVSGLGRPITGTSANLSGQPPALTGQEAMHMLGVSVDLVVMVEGTSQGLPSTILDATGPVPRLIRLGAVALSDIQTVHTGEIESHTIVDGSTRTL